MRNTINEKATQLAVWVECTLSEARSDRGEVSVEWIVIAAALVALIFAAFTALGGGIQDWIDKLINLIGGTLS